MKEIPLSKQGPKNLGKYVALVDDDDYETLIKMRWSVYKKEWTSAYASTGIYIDGKKKWVTMHRFILGLTDPKMIVDHIDHNGLNNQRSNLRLCSVSQNAANRVKRQKTSVYKGVCLHKQKLKNGFHEIWIAQIRHQGNKTYLGVFKKEIDAAIAYNIKALELFGEFACINKIPTT